MTSILTTMASPAGPLMVRATGRAGADSGSAGPAFIVDPPVTSGQAGETVAQQVEGPTASPPRSARPALSPSVMAVMLQVQERLVEREGVPQARAIAARTVDRALAARAQAAAEYRPADNPVRLLNDCLAQALSA